jgi:SpoVK/Ycf46/Vps4 family AAA+-type ATPase
MQDVGGLGLLKDWLHGREKAFGKSAKRYGLPAPRGIALIGIPGTGKSLTAKTVASLWRMPLLRMDIGAMFGSLVGQSEENCRRALGLAETIAPCVLWIDEIEKGLATGDNDGGTSQRVLGTMLSWMQEKTKPVFVVATANDVGRLPPELLRRGRFDEIFFLDLPTEKERREILTVHVKKRGRDPEQFDLDRMARASQGHVGSEIEQAIIEAMYQAFNDPEHPEREFTSEDVVAAMVRLVPLSRSQREMIEHLRRWLTEGRAQSASFAEASQAEEGFVPIPIEPLAAAG